ncbi:uncharacterized protein LOC125504899, partial [Dendroctonus ponderosae]|uniref:uncharacterized protein LOC125503095 n=1 Tax=Dendroctonus ponderosae TaxID=77166 RepID=UPI002035DA39
MPDTNLNTLKKDKRSLKTVLTRFKNFIENFNVQIQTHKELELRIEKIEPILDSFYETQRKIENLSDITDNDLDQETEAFEDTYFKYIGVAKSIVDRHIPESRNGSVDGVDTTSQSQVQSLENQFQQFNIKLPPMPLPSFDGAYDQWLFFKDTFVSLIHENEAIPNIQKFHYLRLSLKGSAADLLKCLQISASNYSIAWDLLVKRFENSQILIRFHIKALFDLEILKRESHVGLRNLLDSMNKHLRALEVLKQPIDSWDALVIHIISLKLDSVTRKEWEIEYSKLNVSNLKVFTAFLQEKSKLLETLFMNNPSNILSKGKRHSFVASNSPRCSFCNKEHTVYNCKAFLELNVNKRISEAKRGKWCLNCLRTNHRTEQCRSSPCRKCSKKHNTLLHNNTFSQEQTSNNASFSYPQAAINDNQFSRAESVSNDNKLNSDFTNSYHCYNGTPRVLLSTAIVDVLDSDGNVHSCRVMLDSGSESSFITEKMFNKLNLCTTSTNISVSGIGLVTSKVV